MEKKIQVLYSTSIRLIALVFTTGLAYFAYLGVFTRFWQDDWCYGYDFQRLGLWGTLKGYLYITTYASNRYSLTFFSGILHYLGLLGVKILPGITIALWVAGVFILLKYLSTATRRPLPTSILVTGSIVIVFFSVFLAPNRFQSIYWRSGLLPYTAPTVAGIWLTALILYLATNPQPSKWVVRTLPVLSFIGTGFSEAGGAVIASGLTMLLLITWFYTKGGNKSAGRILPAVSLAWLFCAAGMIVMVLSPANQPRMAAATEYRSSNAVQTILLSIQFALDFVRDTVRGYPLPLTMLVLLSGLSGFLFQSKTSIKGPVSIGSATKTMGMLLLGSGLLIVAMYAPTSYVQSSPPNDRTWIISRFILLFAFALCGWQLGEWVSGLIPGKTWKWAALVLLLLPIGYSVRAIKATYDSSQPRFEKIASVWDERDLKIRTEKAQGKNEIEVRAIDSAYLGQVGELGAETNWINNCAASYYQVGEIRASLPW